MRIEDPELKITRLYAMVKCMTENNIAFRKYLLSGNYDEPFIEEEESDCIPVNIRNTG